MRSSLFCFAVMAAAIAGMAWPALAAEKQPSDFEQQARKQIAKRYAIEVGRCKGLLGNALNMCQATADGRREIAEAQLALRVENSGKNLRQLALVLAKARYRLETTLCDEERGKAREECQVAAQANLARYMAVIKKDEEMEASSAIGSGKSR